ncbi:MAG: tRNA dihydrouridine synthase DusB [Propioniciclava sp.]
MSVTSALRLVAPGGGTVEVPTPVVLAPMAGITNLAYRQLCQEQGAGLYVCEMITARGIVEQNPKTQSMVQFASNETIRSVQLYGVDPPSLGRAAGMLCADFGVNHLDINLGCPVPKVTRRGGGGALPWKRDRTRALLRAVVRAADPYGVPVTMKTRIGIDDDHITFRDAGRIAQDEGIAAVALHARTVQQAYSGEARWEHIAALAEDLDVPVLGNGDIWEADDARRMMAETGCAGVVIGRGCLGRPWLFRDLADSFSGREETQLPTLGEVGAMVRRHAELLAGLHGEQWGLTDLRKHMAWYFKGFGVGGELRRCLATVCTLAELDEYLGRLTAAEPFPRQELGKPRGRQGSPREKVVLPHRWLESTELGDADISSAEDGTSGG